MEIVVKNCKNCPFAEYDLNDDLKTSYANCLAPVKIHDKYNIDSYYKNYKSPNWCPLKSNDLIIKFKKSK